MPRTRKIREGNPHLDERELNRLGRIGSTATSIATDPLSYYKGPKVIGSKSKRLKRNRRSNPSYYKGAGKLEKF